jgi:hypothetical protein
MHMQLLPSIFISGLVLLKINSCNLLFFFFLISQILYQKAQRGATLSTLGVYKRD